MSAERRLAELRARKDALRARIRERREAAAVAAHGCMRPVRIADKALALWHATPEPVKSVGVPLAVFAAGKLARRLPLFSLAKYLPLAAQGWRMVRQMRR